MHGSMINNLCDITVHLQSSWSPTKTPGQLITERCCGVEGWGAGDHIPWEAHLQLLNLCLAVPVQQAQGCLQFSLISQHSVQVITHSIKLTGKLSLLACTGLRVCTSLSSLQANQSKQTQSLYSTTVCTSPTRTWTFNSLQPTCGQLDLLPLPPRQDKPSMSQVHSQPSCAPQSVQLLQWLPVQPPSAQLRVHCPQAA